MVSRTDGSAASGSRSSKFEMRESMGQTMWNPPSEGARDRSTASSAGSR